MIEPISNSIAGDAAAATHQPLHVLYILGPSSPGDWLQRALHDGAAESIRVMATPSLMVGFERLREHAFDVVVVDRDASDRAPAELLLSIQASTHDHQAVIILADDADRQNAAEYLMAGAAAYLCLHQTTIQELVWQLYASSRTAQLHIDNQRLRSWQQRYREQEQHEVLCLLEEQSTLFALAARLRDEPTRSAPDNQSSASATETANHADLSREFRDLLQAYILMGRGQLGNEVQRLVDRIHAHPQSLARTLQTYTQAVQSLVQDRGARSSRHVFHRGNLLLLDLLLQWADHVPSKETHEHHGCDSRL